jgi:glycogen operon protein
LLIVMNSHSDAVPFTLPVAVGGSRWVRLIDTNDPDGEALALRDFRQVYDVAGRSLHLFVLQPSRTSDRSTAAERSFQRVVQAMDDASAKSVRFGFD